jgi:peroxiredoxin (alkyl hydroperoxide reductase subunit C)
MQVPEFKAQAFQNNDFIEVTQDSLKGKWAILFFYPADFTFVCPTELGDIADQYEKLQSINTEVYSVSTDSHFVHKAWWDTSDTIKKIKFPMIADPTGALSRALGTYIEEDGMATRATFIIDPEGIIQVAEYSSTSIGRSAEEIVRKVQAAQFVAEHDGEVCPANWKPGSATLKPGLDLVGKI